MALSITKDSFNREQATEKAASAVVKLQEMQLGRKAGTEEGFKYSDALIKLGEAGEVLLRSGTSGPDRAVTALGWSADGRHLALGTAGGEAAIVTFPDQFFK